MSNDGNGYIRMSRVPGMPCPECGQGIAVDPMTLLARQPVKCAACGLELHINMDESAETLQALGTYMQQLSDIEQGLNKSEVPGTSRRTRRVRERPRRRPR